MSAHFSLISKNDKVEFSLLYLKKAVFGRFYKWLIYPCLILLNDFFIETFPKFVLDLIH